HLQPQRKSLVNDLLTDTETLSNVIKLIAEELELFLSCRHKVDLLRRTRRGQPTKNELSVRVLSVETCTVPPQQGVSLIVQVARGAQHLKLAVALGGKQHCLSLQLTYPTCS